MVRPTAGHGDPTPGRAVTVSLPAPGRRVPFPAPPRAGPVTVDRPGNTGSAGLFTALHSALAEGALLPRDTYVPAGIGAGFQWGSLCLRDA
ncbi:3-oxoacyl-[acyl-carrier-protein] synthase III C-terminal domain-containing protein [Streptomyces olivaceus]